MDKKIHTTLSVGNGKQIQVFDEEKSWLFVLEVKENEIKYKEEKNEYNTDKNGKLKQSYSCQIFYIFLKAMCYEYGK